ncbi:MAG: hypothetical protein IKZ07_04195 [Akkermansia sp.]|nr:hypothetical protein [Akkermansia sp.]
MKLINSIIAAALLAMPSLFALPMPDKADLLATNTIKAVYMGTQERPCMFRTALCPNRCGHAAKVAAFQVIENESYSKPGKYGDGKAEAGSVVMVDVKNETPGQDEAVNKLISTLTPGDTVRMTQEHYYGDFGGCMSPFRPITKIEKLGEKAPAPEVQPEQHPVMPIMRRVR